MTSVLPSEENLRPGGHVLVIGVDGVRFDLVGPATAPSVWTLGQAGFLAPVPVDEATPTWSGPCWATIATGTGVAGHGITGNDLTGHRLVGRLLGAVRCRPAGEDWTVVVVTDHGHLDEGGHGGREPEVVTAWAAAAGPGIRPGALPLITRQEQVAPLVLDAAGWPADRG
jgi:predicted AlkP superfamily pyrophosphatase or phosphodiesterase